MGALPHEHVSPPARHRVPPPRMADGTPPPLLRSARRTSPPLIYWRRLSPYPALRPSHHRVPSAPARRTWPPLVCRRHHTVTDEQPLLCHNRRLHQLMALRCLTAPPTHRQQPSGQFTAGNLESGKLPNPNLPPARRRRRLRDSCTVS